MTPATAIASRGKNHISKYTADTAIRQLKKQKYSKCKYNL